jgi:hypothetical protein
MTLIEETGVELLLHSTQHLSPVQIFQELKQLTYSCPEWTNSTTILSDL